MIRPPRVVRKGPGAEPVPPEADGGVDVGVRLLLGGRRRPRPGQGDEARLTLMEGGPDVGAGTDLAELEAGVQPEGYVPVGLAHGHRVVAVTVVAPGARCGPVVEHREAHRRHVDLPRDAGGGAQDRPDPGADPGDSLVASAPPLVAHRPDDEQVVDHQPPRRSVPCRLQHHRPRYVPAMIGHDGCWPARAGSSRRSGPRARRTRSASPAGAGSATRWTRQVPRDSCSRNPTRTRNPRSAGRCS